MKKQNEISKRIGRKPLSDAEKKPEAMFYRVAGIRTRKIVKLIRNLRNCSNTSVYKYNAKQVAFMFKQIDISLAKTKDAFANPKNGKVAAKANKVTSIFENMAE